MLNGLRQRAPTTGRVEQVGDQLHWSSVRATAKLMPTILAAHRVSFSDTNPTIRTW